MGEIGDYWREAKEYRRSAGLPARRSVKRAAEVVKLTKEWAALGFEARTEWHWQTRITGDLIDFWPSKAKWMRHGEVHTGRYVDLQAMIRTAVKEKEPRS